jgi:hypothetical protein
MKTWRILMILFLVGTSMWVGAAVYAVHSRKQSSNQNCEAIKHLRSDLVRVLQNYRDKSQVPYQRALHDQAIHIVEVPHCEVK